MLYILIILFFMNATFFSLITGCYSNKGGTLNDQTNQTTKDHATADSQNMPALSIAFPIVAVMQSCAMRGS